MIEPNGEMSNYGQTKRWSSEVTERRSTNEVAVKVPESTRLKSYLASRTSKL